MLASVCSEGEGRVCRVGMGQREQVRDGGEAEAAGAAGYEDGGHGFFLVVCLGVLFGRFGGAIFCAKRSRVVEGGEKV